MPWDISDNTVMQNSKRQILFQLILLSIAAVVTFPGLFGTISSGIDDSWQVGLHRTTIEGLRYGREVILHYGPLGYLTVPLLISKNLWLQSVLYIVANHILFYLSLFFFLRRKKPDWINSLYLIVAILVIFLIIGPICGGVLEITLISLLIFNYLYLDAKKIKVLFGLPLAILHSVLFYIKLSDGITAFLLLLTFLSILLLERRFKEVSIIFAAYFFAIVILGLLVIGSPRDIALFFYNSYQIADGYTDAMAISGKLRHVLVAILNWIVYLGLITYLLFKKDITNLRFLILAIGLLFFSFKHGFTRHDLHITTYFFVWTIVFALYYLTLSYSNRSLFKYVVLVFSIMLLYIVVIPVSLEFRWLSSNLLLDKFHKIKISLHLIKDDNFMHSRSVNMKKMYKSYSLKPQTYHMLSGHTVDIFPWDIAIAEQYGLRWIPRPVFQSYFAYTDYLDSLNQRHFLTVHSPEYLLYSFKSIDGRYPLFDEPATFRTILKNYQPVSIDGEFILLRRKVTYETPIEHKISTTNAKIGEQISTPKNVDGYLFARIYMDYNLLGKIAKLFYKPPQVYIQFVVNRDITRPYRFVPSLAKNGIFLSQFIRNQKDLWSVWSGKPVKNVEAIIISAQNSNFYNERMSVEFFAVY